MVVTLVAVQQRGEAVTLRRVTPRAGHASRHGSGAAYRARYPDKRKKVARAVMRSVVAAILLGAASATARAASLAEVQTLIATKGADAAVRELFDGDWEALLQSVATGSDAWLAVATELRPVTDGASSETMGMALQEALLRNPSSVLGLVAKGRLGSADVCRGYGFEQDPEPSTAVLIGLLDKRIKAVTAIRHSTLKVARDACLKELREFRAHLQKRPGAG
jgi:hypothetical protein